MKIRKEGFLQALGVSLYITFIGLIMGNGNALFGNINVPIGPILVLFLFSTSAMICGTIVFYHPYKLFVAGKTKDALEVVISTAAFLFIFLILFLVGVIIFK